MRKLAVVWIIYNSTHVEDNNQQHQQTTTTTTAKVSKRSQQAEQDQADNPGQCHAATMQIKAAPPMSSGISSSKAEQEQQQK
ncbi:hypothetical protein ACLKA7_015327 [Drosophila subpalustris]